MRRICLTVRADVKEFAGDTPASGDITLLAMWVDRREYRSMTVPGDSDRLDEVTGFVEEVLSSGGCPMNTILKMQIVAEEIFVNICDYAYKGVKGDVSVFCRYLNDEIKPTFCNGGDIFDPVSQDDVVVAEDVGEWSIGGFGIRMVKKLVDSMDYKYFAGKNILTVWKRTRQPDDRVDASEHASHPSE